MDDRLGWDARRERLGALCDPQGAVGWRGTRRDVVGRGEGMGRPLLYGTTPLFLEHFALRHLGELPRADELTVALRPALSQAS